jgi:hypothetical protein
MTRQAKRYFVALGSLLALSLTLGVVGCGDDGSNVQCGTGTKLDGDTCVAEVSGGADFNRTVNANLGDLEISNMNVPDVLEPGTSVTQKFTITNKSTSAKPVTALRLSVLGGEHSMVASYLKSLRGDGYACTESCSVPNHTGNKACEDGLGKSKSSVCGAGTDCQDCGPRKGLVPCYRAEQNRYECYNKDQYCEPYSKVCHHKPLSLAITTVEDLKPGESREVSWDLAVPYGRWDGLYSLVLAANEEWLTKDSTGKIKHDDRQPNYAGSVELERAAAVFNAGPVDFKRVVPGIKATTVKADTAAFEVNTGNGQSQPMMTVSSKFLSNHPDNTELTISFELRMPGGAIDRPDTYDRGRKFSLGIELPNGSRKSALDFLPPCRTKQCDPRTTPRDSSDWSVFPTGSEVDGLFRLFLKEDDSKVLASTLDFPQANPGLTSMQELPGQVVMIVDNHKTSPKRTNWWDPQVEVQGSLEYPLDVVFLPPAPNKKASANDANEPPKADPTDDGVYAASLPGGHYGEVDDLTPTFYQQIGSDWLGVSVQVKNQSSKDRLYQAVVKQALNVDNYAAIDVLKQKLYLLRISGDLDWGTRRPIESNKAHFKVMVPPTDVFSLAAGANTLIDATFDGDKHCEADDENADLTKCMVIDGNEDDDSQFGDVSLNLIEARKTVEVSKDKEYRYCYGPLCLVMGVSVTFEAGLVGSLGFFQDRSNDPDISQGVEATMGVFADATGVAYGGVDVFLGVAGIYGSLNFMHAELTPTLRVGLEQHLRDAKPGVAPCWLSNNGFVNFAGPASFSTLSGHVALFVDFGPPDIDAGLFTIHMRSRVVDFNLLKWDAAYTDQWMLWETSTRFAGGPGLCADAPNPATVWKSPVACSSVSGSDSYCANSLGSLDMSAVPRMGQAREEMYRRTGKYTGRFYAGPSRCGYLVIDGSSERWRRITRCDNCSNTKLVTTGGGWGVSSSQSECQACWAGRRSQLLGDLLLVGGDNPRVPVRLQVTDPKQCHLTLQRRSRTTGEQWIEDTGGNLGCFGPEMMGSAEEGEDPNVRLSKWNGTLEYSALSGDFSNTRVRFCGPNILNLWFATDESVALSGLSVKLETDEGEEPAVYSDARWDAATGVPNSINGTDWKSREFEGADMWFSTKAQVSGETMAASPWWASPVAPFTASDAAKAKWIWAPFQTKEGIPATNVRFRRPFLASKNTYTAQVRCDNSCRIYLDGKQVATTKDWWTPVTFNLTTQKGNMHMLAVEATNDTVGAAGVFYMMK